jgi:Raf kinase inhibitor-like YbhB/YbcL family protein
MKISISAVAIAAVLALAPAASFADDPAAGAEPGAALLARAILPARDKAPLIVTSPAFKEGGDIPFENTSYRGNVFPGLTWSHGPHDTKSYAVILQDDDAVYHGADILHWTMYDIPADITKLDAAMTAPPAGAHNGPNMTGASAGYRGPHTPPGPRHHYHFQVFALDTAIAPAPIGSYAALTGAMQGHVLASGELVGLGRVDPNAPPRVPPKPPLTPPPPAAAVPTDPGRISAPPP